MDDHSQEPGSQCLSKTEDRAIDITITGKKKKVKTSQMVKNLPAMWETWVQSLGWDDPLEKGMATHSSIPSWRIPWTDEPGGLQSMVSQRVRHD